MKMRPTHYGYMKAAIGMSLDGYAAARTDGDVPAFLAGYRRMIADQGKSKDVDKRVRWDMLYAAKLSGWISDNLYGYMDDTHIDTALRRIMRELEGEPTGRNARRAARRIVAEESDGARREREIHELEQGFDAPDLTGPGGEALRDDMRDIAKMARRIAAGADGMGEAIAIIQEYVDNAREGHFDSPSTMEKATRFLDSHAAEQQTNRWTRLSAERERLLAASDEDIADIWQAIFPDEEQPDKEMAVEHIVEYRRSRGMFD